MNALDTKLHSFVALLRQNVLVACLTCPAYITRGDVRWDEQGRCWALHCSYCGTPSARSNQYIRAEGTLDA